MNKEIRYNGYSEQPSDYECQDGDLEISLNVIPENGHLRPVLPPEQICRIPQDATLLYLHSSATFSHFIYFHPSFSMDGVGSNKTPALVYADSATPTSCILISSAVSKCPVSVNSIGNTLVVVTESAILYVLWKDSAYRMLGTKPPFVPIEFALVEAGRLQASSPIEPFGGCPKVSLPVGIGGGRSTLHLSDNNKWTPELKTETDNAVLGYLNSCIADKVTSKGHFYQPFFIRYAFRLFDGSYSWHSVPVLMLPCVAPPQVIAGEYDPSNTNRYQKVKLSAKNVRIFALSMRILPFDSTLLELWSDIVKRIDIFVSQPIYTFDSAKGIDDSQILTSPAGLYRNALTEASLGIFTPGIIPPSGHTNMDRGRGHGTSDPSTFFEGHFIAEEQSFNYRPGTATDKDLTAKDHTVTFPAGDTTKVFNLSINPHFHEQIRQTSTFYRISSVEIKDCNPTGNAMTFVSMEDSDMSNLLTRPTLTDDFCSHASLVPSITNVYNSRLSIADINLFPAPMPPMRTAMAYANPSDGSSLSPVSVTVWLRKNGGIVKAVSASSGSSSDQLNPCVVDSLSSEFPRYIYYPDADAFRMRISIPGKSWEFPLVAHDHLNGAYYYGGIDLSAVPNKYEMSTVPSDAPNHVNLWARVYSSEVENPFLFLPSAVASVGSGEVMGLASAVKALSQGQFGQFPLYAFTSEGVWALEISQTGTLIARQPVTRDVCVNPKGITQIDSAVLFPSDRGIMLLSGSTSTCISDPILTESKPALTSLPEYGKLYTLSGINLAGNDIVGLKGILSDCRMIYDYAHQRIFIYSPSSPCSYVYSLKSKLWGMAESRISYGINSYPDALAVTSDGYLVGFSSQESDSVNALIISRPLKIDAPDTLKTIRAVLQRGMFRNSHVKSVLYGSIDLYSWHLIWSSKNHTLKGFSGTPYKYFRIALICSLSADESIFGASVQFTVRFTNQLR